MAQAVSTPSAALELELSAALGVGRWALLRCGKQRCHARLEQNGFLTREFALVFLTRGICSFRQTPNSPWVELREGQAFKRFPGAAHDVRFEAGSVAWFAAVPAEAFQLLKVLALPNLDQPILTIGPKAHLVERFSSLQRRLVRATPFAVPRIGSDLLSLIVEIHQLANESDAESRALEKAASLLASPKLSVSRVAAECGFRYSTFRLAFKRHFGMSPVGFRVKARLDRAAALLLETDRSIGEIADELGYPDVYAFSAQFKRATGANPSRFRKLRGV